MGTKKRKGKGSGYKKAMNKNRYSSTVKSARTFSKTKKGSEISGLFIITTGVLLGFSVFFESSIGTIGLFIRELLFGLFGCIAYILPPSAIVYGIYTIFKKDTIRLSKRVFYFIVFMILASAFLQTASYRQSEYVNLTLFTSIPYFYKNGVSVIGGGILGGLLSLPLLLLFKTTGTIIILTALSIADIIMLTNFSISSAFSRTGHIIFHKRGKGKEDKNTRTLQGYNEKDIRSDEVDDEEFIKINKKKKLNYKLDAGPAIIRKDQEATDSFQRNNERKISNRNFQFDETPTAPDKPQSRNNVKYQQLLKQTHASGQNIKEIALNNNESSENVHINYKFPPLDLLNREVPDSLKSTKVVRLQISDGARKLEETLASFGVGAKVINVSRGPSITRYELQPDPGVKVSRIVSLSDDISLNLASAGVRIEAPIPGKAAIGIEVPNKEVAPVFLREILESNEFDIMKSKLAFGVGRDVTGVIIAGDVSKMPHLLIAGATGSGKSVCLNNLIISILYKASPEEVKMIMVDPKVVELTMYNGIPHLLIPVVTNPKKAAGALNWAVQEMVTRYGIFAECGVKDIDDYNELVKSDNSKHPLHRILIIIDELADLMMAAPNEVEDSICRLAQMSRAAGMHLVIATQRPSVNVITGIIKANIPSRISFAVASQVDSRTILDMGGAEKLLGCGDMLYFPSGLAKPLRVQGAYLTEKEKEKVVDFIKKQWASNYNNDIIEKIENGERNQSENPTDNDEHLPRAIDLVVDAGQASASLIQRKFKVGYARASRIIDQMEVRGIVGGFEGSKPRKILISKQEWQEMKMNNKDE